MKNLKNHTDFSLTIVSRPYNILRGTDLLNTLLDNSTPSYSHKKESSNDKHD